MSIVLKIFTSERGEKKKTTVVLTVPVVTIAVPVEVTGPRSQEGSVGARSPAEVS